MIGPLSKELSAAGRTNSPEVRTALVGLGKMGLSHLAILRTHPDINVVAVCDTFGMLLSGLNRYTGRKTIATLEAGEAIKCPDECDAVAPLMAPGENKRWTRNLYRCILREAVLPRCC